ncbi:Magnesium transporter [Metarhizium robertsii ARSEF 23]|uniref:Magnesium transporter n=1 Tax=Metarhizium robertsii (strain ARSEF 23 / ATCC MYA-3075) TaxID=655844 RepID=A0A0B2XF49_METRA|nr:Magnesium transporter [Metarhizium robertsii ARSEF 23]KHO11380.1 Magnesium transporter [Metarhizium robertsii ARSEF 23]
MKSAFGVIFTAALGTALPHVGWSTPAAGSSNINATNESKLPWVNVDSIDSNDFDKCMETSRRMSEASPPSGETVNRVCGTENFCGEFNPAFWSKQEDEFKKLTENYGFANTQACFDAHEQKPAVSQ